LKLFVRILRVYDSCFLIAITRYLAALVDGGIVGLRRSVKDSNKKSRPRVCHGRVDEKMSRDARLTRDLPKFKAGSSIMSILGLPSDESRARVSETE